MLFQGFGLTGSLVVMICISYDIFFEKKMKKIISGPNFSRKLFLTPNVHNFFLTRFPSHPASILDKIHKAHPTKFIMATEACHEKAPLANSTTRSAQWKRAALYSKDIIENLNHWSVGWLDWNLWLDERGGPNWAENHVDSPVLISGERQEVLVQPM